VTPFRAADPTADRRVLIVDDEPSIREPLSRFLTARGYEVHTANAVAEAIVLLDRHQFGAILCDVRMPGQSGLDLLPIVRQRDEDCAVIMLTGVNDAATATESLAHGAVDYLTKPVELERLAQSISAALERRRVQMDERDVERLVREEVALRTAALEREKLALRAHAIEVLATVVTLSEAKVPFHAGHARRSAQLAARIAGVLGLDIDTIELVETAGRVRDIGKIAIPEGILVQLTPLNEAEQRIVREHVQISVELLTPLRHLAALLPFVHDHHERWDGTGYPEGLRGEDISIGGRILAVADAYVAVTSGRAYVGPLTPEAALARLEVEAGRQFDPAVLAALRTVIVRTPT
jgi:putative two-component system response regulator